LSKTRGVDPGLVAQMLVQVGRGLTLTERKEAGTDAAVDRAFRALDSGDGDELEEAAGALLRGVPGSLPRLLREVGGG
jgi:hypothetical protein